MIQARIPIAFVLALLLAPAASADGPDDPWWDGFGWPGISSPARAIVSFRGDLYVSDGRCLLRWDDPDWTCVASAEIDALLVTDDHLYAGGEFSEIGGVIARNIARWDGALWHSLGNGVDGRVEALAEYGGAVIVGGRFNFAGDISVQNLAAWNGQWSDLGGGVSDASYDDARVQSLYVHGGDLYVGGSFETAGAVVSHSIARWDGHAWHSLGTSFRGGVEAIVMHGDMLFVAGFLVFEDPLRFYPLALRIDDAVAIGHGNPVFDTGYCFLVDDGELFAGGNIGGHGLVRWDGADWVPASLDVGPTIQTAAVHQGTRILGGSLGVVEGEAVFNILRWEGTSWERLGPDGEGMSGDYLVLCPTKASPQGAVNAFAAFGGHLVAGGRFTAAGTELAEAVACFDGAQWSRMGEGLGSVLDLTIWHGQLIAAGIGVVAWDGASWTSLIDDLTEWGYCAGMHARSVMEYDGSLIAAGWFEHIDGVEASNIARWNGSVWAPLGSGVARAVYDLAEFEGDLVAAGNLTRAGSTDVSRVARWDGADWSAMGDGIEGSVYTLLANEGNLYAGGYFGLAGVLDSRNIARWNGDRWVPLGMGTDGWIQALEFYGDRIIAGGSFDSAGGVFAPNIAFWDGASWESLGSGIQRLGHGGVVSLLSWSGRLYVGGSFVAAGGKPSFNIARWRSPAVVPVAALFLSATRVDEGILLRWSLAPTSMAVREVEIWRARDDAPRRIRVMESSETSWLDRSVLSDESYRYHAVGHVHDISVVSNTEMVSMHEPQPARSRVIAIAPNPFNPRTEIRFEIGKPGPVRLRVLDLAGREVWSWKGELAAGPQSVIWGGTDRKGFPVASGAYLVRLDASDGVDTHRALLLR